MEKLNGYDGVDSHPFVCCDHYSLQMTKGIKEKNQDENEKLFFVIIRILRMMLQRMIFFPYARECSPPPSFYHSLGDHEDHGENDDDQHVGDDHDDDVKVDVDDEVFP